MMHLVESFRYIAKKCAVEIIRHRHHLSQIRNTKYVPSRFTTALIPNNSEMDSCSCLSSVNSTDSLTVHV